MNRLRGVAYRYPGSVAMFLVLWCLPLMLRAKPSSWGAGGYLKNLLTWSDGPALGFTAGEGRWQNTTQFRLNLRWYPVESVTACLESRHLAVLQRNIGKGTGYLGVIPSQTGYYLDLEGQRVNRSSLFTTAVDRMYLDWTYRSLEVTAGRQRVAWGTCLVWNPTDLFNPYSVLDFDYEEKPGTDALRIQVYTGAVSTVELAGAPGRTDGQTTYGMRYLSGLGGYDISMVAGWERRFWRLGLGWAGQIEGGGFRGEVLYSKPGETIVLGPGVGSSDGAALTDFWTLALSYDYTFRNSFYVHSELLYNGLGTTDDAGLRRAETIITGELSPARYSVFQELAYDITPLLRCDIFAIANPSDRSWTCVSSLAYSLSPDWELSAFVIPSGGRTGSEFGGIPGQAALRIRYDF